MLDGKISGRGLARVPNYGFVQLAVGLNTSHYDESDCVVSLYEEVLAYLVTIGHLHAGRTSYHATMIPPHFCSFHP